MPAETLTIAPGARRWIAWTASLLVLGLPGLPRAQQRDRYLGPLPYLRAPQLKAPKGWAVVLVDMQERGPHEGQARCGMSEHRARRVVKPQALFLKGVRRLGIPVVVVETKGDGRTLSALRDQLDPARSYTVEKVAQKDAFNRSGISTAMGVEETLRQWGADKVVLFGVNRTMCVAATARGAVAAGFRIFVPDRLNDDFFLAGDAIEKLPHTRIARELFETENRRSLGDAKVRDPFRRSSNLLRIMARDLAGREGRVTP